ncbi:MAG: serine hydrolase, partial [Bacteroidetes bacterium HGW-Bacteroidetes-22]
PFYRQTIAQPQQYYRDSLSITYSIKVADRLFLRLDYRDSIMNQIIQSPVNSDKSYKYSDLGFILLKEAVEKITDSSFDRWLDANFYAPLSLNTMGFKPWTKYPSGTIMPTEDDHEWRKQLVHGYVHDQAAAMMGGVSGHAGLFGNANDATIVMQMLLQKGSYGGQRFIKQTTIREFCKAPFADAGNHRGIGFDKPPLHPVKDGPVCGEGSSKSFGHSGFTGTYVWADPGNMLVYTFLSNRVYPLAENKKLSQMNIRTRIHSVAYKAVRSAQKPNLTSYPRNVNPYVLLINNSKMGLLFNSWR